MKLNADLGERGTAHPIDDQLLAEINIANIACGGHAGDSKSSRYYFNQCLTHDVIPVLHLSYPDKENFGRISINIDFPDLEKSLNQQQALLPEIKMIKFHGALYHDSAWDVSLARKLCDWVSSENMQALIVPPDCPFAELLSKAGISCWAEVFADRHYYLKDSNLSLIPRHLKDIPVPHSPLNLNDLKKQVRDLMQGKIKAFDENKGQWEMQDLKGDTLCIHSDHPDALENAKTIKALLQEKR